MSLTLTQVGADLGSGVGRLAGHSLTSSGPPPPRTASSSPPPPPTASAAERGRGALATWAGPGATGAADSALSASAGGSRQARRATELANTVFAGVKHKMSAMKSEMGELREETASLRTQLCERERQAEEAKEKLRAEAEERLAETKEASELSIARHLGFIDRLLADKQELSKQCEALGAQMKALEDKCVACTRAHACMHAHMHVRSGLR